MTDDEFRDDFGDEIIEALGIRARDLAPVTPAAAVRRHATRTRAGRGLIAAAVLAVAVAAIGTIAANRRGEPRLRVAAIPSSKTTGSSTFSSSGVLDWTWVSDDDGWALVRKPCRTTVCVALRATTDGGRTWNPLPTPDALYDTASNEPDAACADQACLSGVRFATSKVGWLFGRSLFRTTDGGKTWTRESSAAVIDVEAAHGVAMRSTTERYDCVTCNSRIDRVRLPATSWKQLSLAGGYLRPQLLLQGTDAYVVNYPIGAGGGETHLRYSSDRGTTWTAIDDPCAQPPRGYRASGASAAPGGVFVVLCAKVGTTSATVQISSDHGKTFGPRRAVPGDPLHFGPIAAATDTTIAVAYSDRHKWGVLVSEDGGETWRSTLTLVVSSSERNDDNVRFGWQDANTARTSFNSDSIWTTRDGGRSWTEDRVAP